MGVKGQTGELLDVLRWSDATIEWADGDPTKGALLVGSPLGRVRAMLARAHGDEAAYRDYRDGYFDMATSFGFEGDTAWAEAVP
jgi:adenylate cyclase